MAAGGTPRRVAFVADNLAHLPLYERISTELGKECDARLYRWRKMGGIRPFDRPAEPHTSSKRSFTGTAVRFMRRALKNVHRKLPRVLWDVFRHLAVAGLYLVYSAKILPQVFTMRRSGSHNFRVAFCAAVVRHARDAAVQGMGTRNTGARQLAGVRRMLHLLPLWRDAYRSSMLAQTIISDRVELVVFPEDNILSGAALLLCQSLRDQDADIPTVAVQYTMGVEAEWRQAFAGLSRSSRAQRLSARTVRRMWPHMYDEVEGIPIAFPLNVCTRIDAMQVDPVAPWSGYGGNVDVHIVDTQREYDVARVSVPPSVQVVLAEALEVTQVKSLRRREPLTRARTTITIALPPNHFEHDLRVGSVLQYDGFLAQLVRRMAECELLGHRVRYCAHPRLTREKAYGLLQERGIHIEPSLLAALADSALLITFGSAIRRFASDLTITAIDWDVFGFRSAEEPGCDGFAPGTQVVHAGNVKQFEDALKKFLDSSPMQASKNSEVNQRPEIADVLRGLLR